MGAVDNYSQILMGKPAGLSYETQTDQSALQRKRRMVQMLLQQVMQPGHMIDAGQLKVANWGDALAKVAAGIAGGRLENEVTKEEQGVSQANRERQTAASEQFLSAIQGAQPQGPMPDGSAMPQQRPNLVQAMRVAMESGSPELKAIGEKMLLEQQKQNAPKLGEVAGMGYQLMPGPDGPQVGTAPINRFEQDPNTPTLNRNLGTGEVRGTTYGDVTPPQPAKKFNEALQKEDVKVASEGREKSKTAWGTLQMLADAENQINSMPAKDFGLLAPAKAWINKLGASFGGTPFPEGVALEKVASLMGERLIERLRLFAPVSNSDAQRMQEIAGSTSNTKEALLAVIEYAGKIAGKYISEHNAFVEDLEKQEGYGKLDRYKAYSSVTAAPPIQLPSVESDMQKYGKKK